VVVGRDHKRGGGLGGEQGLKGEEGAHRKGDRGDRLNGGKEEKFIVRIGERKMKKSAVRRNGGREREIEYQLGDEMQERGKDGGLWKWVNSGKWWGVKKREQHISK